MRDQYNPLPESDEPTSKGRSWAIESALLGANSLTFWALAHARKLNGIESPQPQPIERTWLFAPVLHLRLSNQALSSTTKLSKHLQAMANAHHYHM